MLTTFCEWLLTKEVDSTTDALSTGDVHCRNFDLSSSERHLGLYFPRPCRTRRRRRQVGDVQPQRSTTRHSGVGHVLDVG